MNTFDFKNYLVAGGVDQQLTESQVYEEINIIFEEFLNDPSNENLIKEEKNQLEEALTGLIIGGILSFPKLLTLLGKLLKTFTKVFGKNPNETSVAKWIESKGEALEKKYIQLIMKIVKLTGLAQQQWKNEDGSIDEEKLEDTAEILFALVLALAAMAATGDAISAFKEGSAIFGALETGLTGIKSAEIAQIVRKVGTKLAGIS